MYVHTRLGRLALMALALTIVLGLPLTAAAQGESDTVQARFELRLAALSQVSPVTAETTRGEYVRLLYLAAGAPAVSGRSTFIDVLPGDEFSVAITWAEQSGIAPKAEDGHFHPRTRLTREDQEDLLTRTLAALGASAQKLANSLLAAYSGRTEDEDWALTPAALVQLLDRMDQAPPAAALPRAPGYADAPR